MTRIVCISDVHLDKVTMGVPRFEEGKRALWEAAAQAARHRAVFAFLGDLSDPDDNVAGTLGAMSEAVAVATWLDANGIPSIWIAGNHDVDEGGSGRTTLGPVRALRQHSRNVHVMERPTLVDIWGVTFACLPFAPVSHAYDPDEAMREMLIEAPDENKMVILSHLSVPGIIAGEETEEMPRGRDMPFPFEASVSDKRVVLRLSGHYHKRQVFDPGDGGVPIQVVGAPVRFSAHDEHAEPGFLIIDL
jgi:DNA repair exonuclease SbcCD nuclease subunit